MRQGVQARREELHLPGNDRELARLSACWISFHADYITSLDLVPIDAIAVRRFVALQVGHHLQLDTLAVQNIKGKFATRFSNAVHAPWNSNQ